MQKSAKIALIAVVVVILVGGGGFYWFVLRSDNPTEVTLRDRSKEQSTGSSTGAAPSTADGTWKVQPDSKVFVGYRIQELFAGETIKKEAVGRTGDVTGTMIIKGQQVTAVELSADMTKLKSDASRRDNFIRNAGLETDKFKTATFKLTSPIQLPSAPKQGEKLSVSATGDLTVHGQTKSVTIPLEAIWTGSNIDVSGKIDINLADYQIEKISIPSVTIEAQGKLEIALSFVPS